MNTIHRRRNTLVLRPNGDLLAKARRIFGEKAVVGAWFSEDSMVGVPAARDKVVRTSNEFTDDGTCEIDVSNKAVVIGFANMRHVMFSTSEWGHIELVEDDVVEIADEPKDVSL